ncbi:MAG: hypothetical protein RL111_2035 [Pseudomonadota bacterium]
MMLRCAHRVARALRWVAWVMIGLGVHGAMAQTLVMASTTSTEQSGLFKHLLPRFKADTGIEVKVVALGTGQALDVARRGDADLVLVHDPVQEQAFVEQGHGLVRHAVMYNDLVWIGPASDPAGIAGKDGVQAIRRMAQADVRLVSRGDNSGTHHAEQRLMALAGLDPSGKGFKGLRSCGCGMGAALNLASSDNAHVLSDRGTWLNFRNRGQLRILVEGDERLFNPYSVMAVNPARHPHVQQALAQRFIDWVTSPVGQAAIAGYRVSGEQAFFPNARR